MARKQVLVQLEDELLASLDREARREKISRSELIRRAVNAWFDAKKVAELERRHKSAYELQPEEAELGESLDRIAAENALPYTP